jgi:hypothetical protein
MKNEDLLLLLNNPELSKAIINVLSEKSSAGIKNPGLEKVIFGETNLFGDYIKPVVPAVTDLRDKGHKAASNFAKDYVFTVGKKFVVWFTGHESTIRQALERVGYKTSINTLSKGKKYEIKILAEIPAKKKSA